MLIIIRDGVQIPLGGVVFLMDLCMQQLRRRRWPMPVALKLTHPYACLWIDRGSLVLCAVACKYMTLTVTAAFMGLYLSRRFSPQQTP